MIGRTLRRGIVLATAGIALLASSASLAEATPIPIGARVRLTGSQIRSSDRVGVLVTRDDATIRLQVHGSEVVTISIADIDGVEVAQGKRISWKNIAIGTAIGVGLAASVHGPGPPHTYSIDGKVVSGSSCSDTSLTCSTNPSLVRALDIVVLGVGGLLYRSDRWVVATPADLRRPPTHQPGVPQAGPPEPATRSVAPTVDENRAGTRIRLTLSDGEAVKGTLTSLSATQWTIQGDDGKTAIFDRQRVSRAMEWDGKKDHLGAGLVIGAVAGLAQTGVSAATVASALVDGFIGSLIKSDKWKPFSGDPYQEPGGKPQVQIQPTFGRGQLGVALRVAW